MPSRESVLAAAVLLLRPRLPRLLLAVALTSLSLCSALALAGVSAWLITRAWQMPPVLDLAVAVVAVRALAISRGILHYCGRLASHDAALRAAGNAREQIYLRLAGGPLEAVMRRRSGELVTRLGADVDELADVLVRALLPIAVAVILGVVATTVLMFLSPAAAVVLAVSLLAAGLLAPWLAARATVAQETAAAQRHCARDVAAMTALEHAPELRVSGRLPEIVDASEREQRAWGAALDRAAGPAAVASAVPGAAVGISVLGAAVAALGLAHSVAPTTVAVLMLLPLSAFEATTALPAAAVALSRARTAARRLLELSGPATPPPATGPARVRDATVLAAVGMRSGYAGIGAEPITLELAPGSRTVITGPSGCGKTAGLMTLAGLLAPRDGRVTLGGEALDTIDEAELRSAVGYFAEDAHLFDTTIRDNLLVARGDASDDELVDALRKVGLHPWLAGLPAGLDTVLTGGARAVSAGQRRRLLLARATLSQAAVVLLDEPTEHLDATDAASLLAAVLDPRGDLFDVDRTVVVATHQLPGHGDRMEIRSELPAPSSRSTAAVARGIASATASLRPTPKPVSAGSTVNTTRAPGILPTASPRATVAGMST